ncbi:Pentalenolactone D synthase [Tolypocladium ophioglossoides CBS 100239]|uniref:Pentalenolactone D synthase n=1 Tax=Tolypocladium ophioglossoides (strain CBS 100239) TaxID=1163406 RepID=A0A0L0N8E7_TOLOC|nr:Pentalenolactone D synthase [Tolypocladium ophioglossoides CBS 100239]
MTVNSAPDGANSAGPDLALLTKKYDEEKDKRTRADGNAQYVELGLSQSGRLSKLAEDPWVDHEALNAQQPNLRDGDGVRFLILGAGYGGLQFGVHLVEAGFRPEEIRIVDTAGGFGGTWYWNRYPGLMCDVESSIYMPLLEETGYMPKHRFSYGPELRQHAENVAKKWNLSDKAVFRTQLRSCEGDEAARRWKVALTQGRGPGEEAIDMTVAAQFVILANGILNHPKAPKIPGIEDFKGPMMHTGRWNYGVSGGSPEDLTLTGLTGKKVGIVGTGATAVQCVPELAKWADQVYVFQRTASAVDKRGQKETDPEEWRQMTSNKGWWRVRNENWNSIICGYPVKVNMVNDAWSAIATYKHLTGGVHEPVGLQEVPELIGRALAMDAPRMERLRKRVDETVTDDKEAADALKAWYPSWCKRPCFHDDYLETFNLPHVTLVDTNAKGIDKITPTGIVAGGKEYDLDVIILSTGYRAPTVDMSEPGKMSNATITGRGNLSLSSKWLADGPTTLHGILTHSFPNLILTGPAQVGVSPNWVFSQDSLARHVAHVVSEAVKRTEKPEAVTIEATAESETSWSMQILMRSTWMAPIGVCGPSYMNNEGAMGRQPQEDLMKAMRGAGYPLGIIAFEEALDQWRREGSMQGIVVGSGP